MHAHTRVPGRRCSPLVNSCKSSPQPYEVSLSSPISQTRKLSYRKLGFLAPSHGSIKWWSRDLDPPGVLSPAAAL